MDDRPVQQPTQNHLLFLDGIRGLAALYVVAHHALLQVIFTYPPAMVTHRFIMLTNWLQFGQMSVSIFIVLSGFCLMLPVARGDGHLRGGFWQFAKRRAWRILPPYYAAVALSLVLIRTVSFLSHPINGMWSQALPAFTPGVIISHLLLVHNWSMEWFLKIDYPLWSVATEWQIYFVFALMLLPLWRRIGLIPMVAVAFAIGYLPDLILHHKISEAGLHLLVLYAFGMCAAVLAVSKEARKKIVDSRAIWGSLGVAGALLLFVLARTHPAMLLAVFSFHDIPVGIATAILLLFLTITPRYRAASVSAVIVRVLESRPLVFLGTFSYSLYLIHAPLLGIIFYFIYGAHIPVIPCFVLCEVIGLPFCMCCSYAFHLVFERPFITSPKLKSDVQADIAAIVSPAS